MKKKAADKLAESLKAAIVADVLPASVRALAVAVDSSTVAPVIRRGIEQPQPRTPGEKRADIRALTLARDKREKRKARRGAEGRAGGWK